MRWFAHLVAAAALATLSATAQDMIALTVCPNNSTINLCLLDQNGTILASKNDILSNTSVDLSNQGIDYVTVYPWNAVAVDLSCNSIASLPRFEDGVLQTLNVSHNALDPLWRHVYIPITVQVLYVHPAYQHAVYRCIDCRDLSYNNGGLFFHGLRLLGELDLTELYFRGNKLTALELSAFNMTASMRLLDLSDNDGLVLTVDTDTFSFMMQPQFTLLLPTDNSTTQANCRGGTLTVVPSGGMVCVVPVQDPFGQNSGSGISDNGRHRSGDDDSDNHSIGAGMIALLVVGCILIGGGTYWLAKRWADYHRRRLALSPRDTLVSSIWSDEYDLKKDDRATEFRETLSPSADRHTAV
ncbi:Aste57867_19770 [Aphanomyces stellatus]|uniref:Aste57867_19770 protein n=1 Tax=Aphanomyces stellatus TaxID=120398 RepID=A0A485LEJ3_9STRA|nr:hypothetical protein As57867_019705 [Aphanomyces stellatus]VFT96468.1 Aste57867_19770 [Aphanomyces stellatus]